MGFGIIPAGKLYFYAKLADYVIIDLRDEMAYRENHIPGALNMPYRIFMSDYKMLPKNKIYVLYCEHGGTSLFSRPGNGGKRMGGIKRSRRIFRLRAAKKKVILNLNIQGKEIWPLFWAILHR